MLSVINRPGLKVRHDFLVASLETFENVETTCSWTIWKSRGLHAKVLHKRAHVGF